jgi:outer membrane protein assembly factor BamB
MKDCSFLAVMAVLAATVLPNLGAEPGNWPQFRGPNGSGVAEDQRPPTQLKPDANAVWSLQTPPGASSPCIWGDRIFITGFENEKLQTWCIRRTDGTVLWKRNAPSDRVERFHAQEGSPAASTPVTDGEHVYVYFGSCGLLCYDFAGTQKWHHPLPPAESFGSFGSGASPVLAGGLVILNRDQVGRSEILAVNAKTGEKAWATDRGQSYGWATPLVCENEGVQEVVLPSSAVLKSYDVKTGAERWQVRGIAAAVISSPVAGKGLLYLSAWSPSDGSTAPPPFGALLEKADKDSDGVLSSDEAGATDLRQMFHTIDLNRDGRVERGEYEPLRALSRRSKNVLLAIRPGGTGDITETHVAWTQTKGLPYVPTPLLYRDRVYLVKEGGLVSCYDAAAGSPVYVQERLGAGGNYYASPVAAAGRIYAASLSGTVTVFEAGDNLKILAQSDLGERIAATPAIVSDTLYVRTATRLMAFHDSDARTQAEARQAAPAADETPLFDGKSLEGWRISDFTGTGKVQVKDGTLLLTLGYMTGITYTNAFPKTNYEISLEAMRVEGSDFFCGLTFPFGETSCSLIVGGWGGNLVGLSSLDYADAANNETTRFIQFENSRWYKIRLKVEPEKIQAWIDDKEVANVNTNGRKVSIRAECEPSLPMGIATYSTTAALRNITLRTF